MKPPLAAAVIAALALAACSKESSLPPTPVPTPVPGAAVAQHPPPPVFANARAKVGPQICKTCHRPQHMSWSASPHAAKGLDCEGCHGGGADYEKVMRDRKAAYQAGLIMPKRALCRACHKEHWHDDMYFRAHAHEAK